MLTTSTAGASGRPAHTPQIAFRADAAAVSPGEGFLSNPAVCDWGSMGMQIAARGRMRILLVSFLFLMLQPGTASANRFIKRYPGSSLSAHSLSYQVTYRGQRDQAEVHPRGDGQHFVVLYGPQGRLFKIPRLYWGVFPLSKKGSEKILRRIEEAHGILVRRMQIFGHEIADHTVLYEGKRPVLLEVKEVKGLTLGELDPELQVVAREKMETMVADAKRLLGAGASVELDTDSSSFLFQPRGNTVAPIWISPYLGYSQREARALAEAGIEISQTKSEDAPGFLSKSGMRALRRGLSELLDSHGFHQQVEMLEVPRAP